MRQVPTIHEHVAKRVHVLMQRAGVPYEIEQQVCTACAPGSRREARQARGGLRARSARGGSASMAAACTDSPSRQMFGSASRRPTRRGSRTTRTTSCGSRWRASSISSRRRRVPAPAGPRAGGGRARDAHPLPRAGAVRRPPRRPRALRRPGGRALPLRVRGRARRRRDRRRLDGARRRRRRDVPADARADVAARRDSQCGVAGERRRRLASSSS